MRTPYGLPRIARPAGSGVFQTADQFSESAGRDLSTIQTSAQADSHLTTSATVLGVISVVELRKASEAR
jgi:hypothetical protein